MLTSADCLVYVSLHPSLLLLDHFLSCRRHRRRRRLASTELLDAAFLVLDTLTLTSRDAAAVVASQRTAAMSALGTVLPVEALLQQQALALHYLTQLSAAVSHNKALLEAVAGGGDTGAAAATPAPSTGVAQNIGCVCELYVCSPCPLHM